MIQTAELQQYGINSGSVLTFGGSTAPELLDYLDLVELRKPQALRPTGVAESQGRPLLFFLHALSLRGGGLRRLAHELSTLFPCPDEEELAGQKPTGPPPGYPSWRAWRAERWPTS